MGSCIKANVVVFAVDGVCSETASMRAIYDARIQSRYAADPRLEGKSVVTEVKIPSALFVTSGIC